MLAKYTNLETSYHIPVLAEEVITALEVKPDGVFIDCTFGGGGHSRKILASLGPKGKLIVFDQDADAKQNLPDDDRVQFFAHNFRHLHKFLRLHQIEKADGLLADLGVSSHQFDEGSRGFSIRYDNADLDMRMDQRQELTAAHIVNNYSEAELHKLFEQYGEVTNAKTLARTIVQQRSVVAIKTIQDFKTAIAGIVKGNPNKYFAQVFQALRIQVNDEMGALNDLMQQLPNVLKPGGRAAIITFHSIEDRIVKNYFKTGSIEALEEDFVYGTKNESPFELLNKKPITASDRELKENSRSRSAKLRVGILK